MFPNYHKFFFPVMKAHNRAIHRIARGVLAIGLFLVGCFDASAQVTLTTGPYPSNTAIVTENFDGIATTTLPGSGSWKVTHSFQLTTTAPNTIAPSTTINVPTATLIAGMAVSGTGIPPGATVQSIINGTSFQLSASTIANINSGTSLLFSNGNTVTWANTANRTSMVATNVTPGTATGNSYVYTAGVPVGTDKSIGIQSSGTYAGPQSIMAHYRNTSGATMTALSINYDMERYRISTQPAQVVFFWSLDGISWTTAASGSVTAGELGTGTNTFTFGAPNPPLIINKTANITGLSLPSGPTGNIYIRWEINCTPTPTQAISIDNVQATATFANCALPTAQPSALTFPSVGTAQISGSFTAAAGPPSNYLVVRYPAGAAETVPVDGTIYTAGTSLGLGTVVSVASGTTFTATGLATATNYDFRVYSFNATSCIGPVYRTASPLLATQATGSCAGLNATIQIDPTGSNVFGTTYTSITNALNDLSGCPITQPTVIELQSTYVSTGESFPIALGAITGASSTNTITIRPALGATNLSITGNSAGTPILNIIAGSWWRVDGRAGGIGTTKNLTVMNTDNTVAFSSAITLINGAQNNIITFCNVRSSNPGVAGGSLSILGTSTIGNSNNTISNNDIFAGTGGIPNVGIGCVGALVANNSNTISNNNIYDFFNPAGNSYGIFVSDLNTNLTISGNSIYQTAARSYTGTATNRVYSSIGVSPATDPTTVTGLTISGNFIGGSSPSCAGAPTTVTDNGSGAGTLVLRAILVEAGSSPGTSIQGNTVQNITFTSKSTSVQQSLIQAGVGAFNIGNVTGNMLGSATGTGSINFTQNNGGRFQAIFSAGTTGSTTISNNTIGSISVSGTAAVSLAGIYGQGASSYTISSNQIGGTTTGSMTNTSPSTNDTWGIYLSTATLTNNIAGNTIQNISSGTGRMLGIRTDGGVNTTTNNTIRNCTSTSTGLTGCIGIWSASTAAGQTISRNTIHSLSNTDGASAATVQGIYYQGPTSGTNVIERNFVHSLNLATSNTAGAMYGIRVLTGILPVDIQNNMVRLGIDESGSAISTGYGIFGISSVSTGTQNFNFNSVYLGGTNVTGTTSNTFCLSSNSAGNTRSFRNNILYTTRSGGSTGKHYAIAVGGSGAAPAGLTLNHNLYLASGSNTFTALYDGLDLSAISDLVSTIGLDANSVSCDPRFISPNGNAASVDLHILAGSATLVEGNGIAIPGITTDFDGQTRASLSPTDIGADAGNFVPQPGGCQTVWTGANSTAWNNSGNWNPGIVPVAGSIVTIPGGTPVPVVSGVQNCLNMTLGAGQTISLDPGSELRVKGNVSAGANSIVSGTGKVVLDGTVTQTISGTFTVSNVDFANTTVGGVVVAPSATMSVSPTSASGSGLVTFLANARLTTNNRFVLRSNSFGTAKIGPYPASATLTGQLTQERLLPIGAGAGGWFFIGSPFSGNNFTNFSDDFRVVSLTGGMPVQGGGIVSSTQPERSTLFKFVEAQHNVRTDTAQKIGWRIPGNENVVPGTGYRAFVAYSTLKNSRLTNRGNLVSGDFTFPTLTRNEYTPCFPTTPSVNKLNCNEGQRGFNLVANPYPCDINWDAPSSPTPGFGWIKPATMNPGWYRWHSAASGYGVYVTGIYSGTTPAPANPNIIPSGQAFFVQLNAPGTYNATLELRESAKVTATSGQFLRTASEQELLRVNISTPMSAFGYDVVVRFMDNATDGFDRDLDLPMMGGTNTNISVPLGQNNLSIASYPWTNTAKTVPLTINYRNGFGNYKLSFSELESMLQNKTIYLRDLETQSVFEVNAGFEYSFQLTAADGLLENRFELLFVPSTVTTLKDSHASPTLSLVPNPSIAQESVTLLVSGLEGSTGQITITDASGKVLFSKSIPLKLNGVTQYLLDEKLATGLYFVKVNGGSKTTTNKLLIGN